MPNDLFEDLNNVRDALNLVIENQEYSEKNPFEPLYEFIIKNGVKVKEKKKETKSKSIKTSYSYFFKLLSTDNIENSDGIMLSFLSIESKQKVKVIARVYDQLHFRNLKEWELSQNLSEADFYRQAEKQEENVIRDINSSVQPIKAVKLFSQKKFSFHFNIMLSYFDSDIHDLIKTHGFYLYGEDSADSMMGDEETELSFKKDLPINDMFDNEITMKDRLMELLNQFNTLKTAVLQKNRKIE